MRKCICGALSCWRQCVASVLSLLLYSICSYFFSLYSFICTCSIVVLLVGAGKSSLLAALLGELQASGMQTELVVGGEVFPVSDNDLSAGREYVKWQSRDTTRVAFCSQRPWIVASSVKANVLLAGRSKDVSRPSLPYLPAASPSGKQAVPSVDVQREEEEEDDEEEDFKHPSFVDEALYQEAISLCKLREDFTLWPERDDTEIGERGVSVSGMGEQQ